MSEVLIVGAGPTGLVAACELLRRGVAIRIIDKKDHPTKDSRALAIHPRTFELLDKLDITKKCLERGHIVNEVWIHKKEKGKWPIHFTHTHTPHPYVLILPQADLEEILIEKVQELAGKIEWEKEFISASNGKARLSSGETVAYHYLLGCDGAHSAVRKSMNLPFVGRELPEHFALADVTLQGHFAHHALHVFPMHNDGVTVLFPLPGEGQFRIVAALKKQAAPEWLTARFFEELLHKRTAHTDASISHLKWSSLFSIQRRSVKKMRVKNQFLLGDAAHVHSPVGGQGLNTCVQDAFNLCWKLALVLKKQAPESLLKTFQKERLPIAHKILRHTTMATRALAGAPPALRKSALPFIAHLMHFRRFATHMSNSLGELNLHYCSCHSPSEYFWKGPKIGYRALDIPLGEGSLFDKLHHTKFTLLIFGKNPEFANFVSENFDTFIDIQNVPLPQPLYGANAPCYYLIRPDGYVYMRAKTFDKKHFSQKAHKLFTEK